MALNVKKSNALFSIIILIGFTLIFFQNATYSGPNMILGKIDAISKLDDGFYYVTGWACQKDVPRSIGVHIYLDRSAYAVPLQGTLILKGEANLPHESSVSIACGNKISHRFKIKLDNYIMTQYKGQLHQVYVHGLRVLGGPEIENSALENSGMFNLPAQETPGCMHSLLAAGKELRSAYPTGFQQAQNDEWIYDAWVWRENPNVNSNHSVSIIKTKDLKNWYNLCGELLTLPITVKSPVVIDQTVMHGGLLNRLYLGFDNNKYPIVSYQKYEKPESEDLKKEAPTQVYDAQFNGKEFIINQMTNWKSRDALEGGGSLPHTDHSISFGAVTLINGQLVQSFTPSDIDLNNPLALPKKGNWTLDNAQPSLSATAQKAPFIDDIFYNSGNLIKLGTEADALENRVLKNLVFTKKTKRPRFDERWVMLRGDWLGEGQHRGGVFDRFNRKFVIHLNNFDNIFYFGPGTAPLWPLVGDWDQDGKDTIGVETPKLISSPASFKRYFKNSLAGGTADNVSGSSKIIDGTSIWHANSPSLNYQLKYEALNSNRDYAYSCEGTQLGTRTDPDIFDVSGKLIGGTTFCRDNFLSKLVLWELSGNVWNRSEIDDLWSGSSADIDFMVFKDKLIVAYYNKDRYVTVAIRSRNGGQWAIQPLSDSKFEGWDAHNYLKLEVDENHDIHLSGNMHAEPLNYWRSSGLNTNFKRYSTMVTKLDELQVTYPSFSRTPDGKLLFSYRKGKSGGGSWIYNEYNIRTKSWIRFLDKELFADH